MPKFSKLEKFLYSFGIRYTYKANLAKYTTAHIGGKALFLVHITDAKEVVTLLHYCKEKKIKYYILGNGSKVVFSNRLFKGVIICLKKFNKITIEDNYIVSEAGAMLPVVCHFAKDHRLSGIEELVAIPGTIGGAVAMNAGAHNKAIGDVLIEATVLDESGIVKTITKEEIKPKYRNSTIFNNKLVLLTIKIALVPDSKVKIEHLMNQYMEQRKSSQPQLANTYGSTFKNTPQAPAWQLIRSIESKCQDPMIKICQKHANFIEFSNNISSQRLFNYIVNIRQKVYNKHGLDLPLEVIFVNFRKKDYRKINGSYKNVGKRG